MSLNIPITTSREESEEVRLLSFDGGDLRAVSQLIILDEFMRRIEEERNSTTRILPCDYFHMVGGVGASGIIVTLLTVLRMGIEETIEEFIEIWNQVFADVTLDQSARSAKLEVVIKDLLTRRGVSESQTMDNGTQGDNSCKAFVCAIPESNLGICEKFRTYKSKETSLNPTIVEAIRATCAVPTLFLPVSIESVGCQVPYVSGAYNFNNPAAETIKEACQYFGRDQRVACMLSLGCGQRAITRLNQANELKVMSLLNDFACDCERVDRDLGWRVGYSNVYYRLSVNQILTSDGYSAINPIGDITSCTKVFLEHHETAAKMNKCAQASERIGGMTLRDISGLNEPTSTSVHGLPPLSEFFVERPSLMATMAQCLFQLGPSTQRRMVLSGLGGIGKTQITIRFLLRYLARFRHILFIDGSSEQSIESGLVAKVKSLGATYSRSSAREALEVLTNPDYEITRDWAIIYDNVDNPEINIGRYIPGCAFGTIIITTRNPNVGILASRAHLKLDVMSEEEATEVLLRSAIDPSREPTNVERKEAHEIAKELGFLPVALVQAGYFIKIHDCLGKYRERLRKRRPDILGRPAEYQLDPHDGLYSCLKVTWPHLTTGAQHFMSILGFVNYTGFPIILLYRAAALGFLFEPFQLADRPPLFQDTIRLLRTTFRPQEEPDEQDVDDLVAELEKYSLVTRMITFKVTTLRLHPLVHSWTRDRLSKEEKVMYKAAAVRLLVCGIGRADEDIYGFIFPHLAVLSNWLGELHLNDQAALAMVASHQGRLQEAIQIWNGIKRNIRSSRKIWSYLVTDDTYELRCSEVTLQLARLHWRPGGFVTSFVMEDEVVKVRKRILGHEHPMTLEAVLQQAHAMMHTSPKNAERLLRGVLNAWERQPGDNWEAVLQTKDALARCCGQVESVGLYREILQARTERNGPDHHATLKAIENLANNSSSSTSATDMWISLVAARTSSRGREHPDTLHAMENLARHYESERLYNKSVDQWKEVIRLRKGVQGAGHDATISAMSALAVILRETGEAIEVTMLLKDIVQVTRERHGPSHPDTLQAMREMLSFYERRQRYTEAEAEVHWKETVQVMTESHGPSHTDTLQARRSLAEVYQRFEQYSKAEAEWKEILEVTRETQGLSHTDTVQPMRGLAAIYKTNQRHTEAELQLKDIVEVMTEAHGSGHADTLQARRDLAEAYQISEQYIEAEAEWKEILQVTKETYGPSHTVTLLAMAELVEFYETRQQYAEAGAEAKELLKATTETYGPSHASTLNTMALMANLYERRRQYTEAEAQWKELVQVMKEAYGPSQFETLDVMGRLAAMYGRAEQYDKAEMQLKEILRTSTEKLSSVLGIEFWCLENLVKTYIIRKKYEEAEAILVDAKGQLSESDSGQIKDSINRLLKEVHVELAKSKGVAEVEGAPGDQEAKSEVNV